MSSERHFPNIIITGTPGCGKTSHCEMLVGMLAEVKHFSISDIAKERKCIAAHDKLRDCDIVDEDKLLDEIEDDLEEGGILVDWHACEIFPESLIDLVVVLRCKTDVIYDRLTERGYKNSKIQENLDVEIMEIIVEEARDNYDSSIIVELESNTMEDLEQNCDKISKWFYNFPTNSENDYLRGITS
ncbi:nucleoside-triphosphatase [Ascoidea rubescens DSM 1968]|uniref:Adenylate kinase isoenzyme 6 homolog n=1 Tax=Ascoidea rubescens DSM 1968 TaxID=1344418 RepID=A0A1D2VQ56_9ASCO|nr:P-loop containing nucleoside triphosphate hydrolase protein [Ascoidea rubescens DSM 1968]ODV63677.1 P-loop containing nucleoside triphosphate hydrolase protein [Ascoidea rubescens DSM 1968]